MVRDGIGYNTSVWLNASRHSDARLITAHGKYGNASYLVTFFIKIIYYPQFNDDKKKEMSRDVSAQCSADELDNGDWITHDCSYSVIAKIPDFPGELIKREDEARTNDDGTAFHGSVASRRTYAAWLEGVIGKKAADSRR